MSPIRFVCAGALMLAFGAAAADEAADERAVREAERAICAAYEREDAAWLAQHLDPGFTLTDSRGAVTTRAEEVAQFGAGKVAYDVFRNRDSKVRFYGDAAVVNGVTVVKGSADGKPFAGEFQFTDTYVRRGGEWVIVASHASRLPEAAPARP